ncbi:hypothetical protein [Paenibacillus wenxiniae]|uniref:Uncharacterized protein n=1 Tax=Paenibacillus wenxiniae TaxID=1636843 RepID=A0ABW4RIY7_9BACL
MLKVSLFSLMTILLMFISPLSILAASVPDEVRAAVERDLQNQQQSISILLNQEQSGQTIHTNRNTKNRLGDGYATYSLKNLATVQHDAYADDVLQFSGYVFIVEDQTGSRALAYAGQAPDYSTITQVASDPNFSDQSFKIPLEKAKQWIGYTSESKLIHDEPHHIVALVTPKDGLEQVIFVENSMLLNMQQFDIIPFKQFIIKIRQAEAEQAKFTTSSDEPLSGGSVSYIEAYTQQSSSSAKQSMFPYFLFATLSVIVIVVAVICYLIYHKRKQQR